jgi:DNA-binding transcriptional LysR family regulator
MSQPACSKLLHELEELAGAALFTRHARGMVATAEGEAFVRHARGALTEIGRATEALSALQTGLMGTVAIGTEATSATGIVPRAIKLMKERYPMVTVSAELAFSETLVQGVRSGRFDLVVARLGSLADEAELDHEPLPPSSHVLAVRREHPLVSQQTVTWPQLLEQSWILPPAGNVMRTSLALLLRRRGLELPRRVVETAALPITISLVQQTDFVAPLPEQVVSDYAGAQLLAALPTPLRLRLRSASIVTRREPPSLTLSAMRLALQECASELVAARDD